MEFFRAALLAESHAENAAREAHRSAMKGWYLRAAGLWIESATLKNFARILRHIAEQESKQEHDVTPPRG